VTSARYWRGVIALSWSLGCLPQSTTDPVSPVAPTPALGLERADRALERGHQSEAIAELLLVAGRCPVTSVERYALLTAAAIALDPSNASRQLDLGASLAARYLATVPTTDAAGRPLARALYLLAIELGAEPSPPTGCASLVSDSAAVAALPHMGAPSVPDRIKSLERELTRLREELLRIRRTLEPS
jgi:hypothetical protein